LLSKWERADLKEEGGSENELITQQIDESKYIMN